MKAARPNILGLECVYYFHDEHGRVLFERPRWRMDAPPPRHKMITYRYESECDRRRREILKCPPQYTKKKHPDADRYLYHLPELLAAKASGDDIWWCEGEKDADALAALGSVATSHHGGAGKISPAQVEWFRGHTGWVILLYDLDDDDPYGGNPGAMDVVRRYDLLRSVGIPRERIMVAHGQAGKDIYDHLEAGYTADDVVPVPDLTDLRSKAARTTRRGLGWAGYRDDPEFAALLREFVANGGFDGARKRREGEARRAEDGC